MLKGHENIMNLPINRRIINCSTLPCMHVPLWQYISDPHSSSEVHETKTDDCIYVHKETFYIILKNEYIGQLQDQDTETSSLYIKNFNYNS